MTENIESADEQVEEAPKPKPKPKPPAKKQIVEPKPEPVMEVVEPDWTKVYAAKETPARVVPPTSYAVVGSGTTDPVHLARCIFKNDRQKKSLSVHHLQRRLNEWGYSEAYIDKDGYYGDLTRSAVQKFQNEQGIEGDGFVNAETLKALFEGDTNVTVVID